MKGKKMTDKEIESNLTKDMDRLQRNFLSEKKFQLHLNELKDDGIITQKEYVILNSNR